MKLVLSILLLGSFVSTNALARSSYWQVVEMRKNDANLFRQDKNNTLYYTSSNTDWFNGESTTTTRIHWSEDDGSTWQEVVIPVNSGSVRVAHMVSNRNLAGIYVFVAIHGEKNRIFHIQPIQKQLNWREIPMPLPQRVDTTEVAVSNTGVLYIMSMHDALWRTYDDGKTWVDIRQNALKGNNTSLNGFKLSSTGTIIVNRFNRPGPSQVLVSSDEGKTFKELTTPKEAKSAMGVNFYEGQNGNMWIVFRAVDESCERQPQLDYVFKSSGDLTQWQLVTDFPILGAKIHDIQENSAGDLLVSQGNYILEEKFYCGNYYPIPIKNPEQLPGLQLNPHGMNTFMLSVFSSRSKAWRFFISHNMNMGTDHDQFIITERGQIFLSPHSWPINTGSPAYRVPVLKARIH